MDSSASSRNSQQAAFEAIVARFGKPRRQRNGSYKALCSSHPDKIQSLSIKLENETVVLHCFAGCKVEDIVTAAGLTMKDLFLRPNGTRLSSTRAPLTLQELARAKGLPLNFLVNLGLKDTPKGVEIPYRHADGKPARSHIRKLLEKSEDGDRFLWSYDGDKIVPYGLDRLEEARLRRYIILTESDSDCWTLWYHCTPALGIPGADMTKLLDPACLEGIETIYIAKHSDAGGDSFVSALLERLGREAKIISFAPLKDVNELHCCSNPDKFDELFIAAINEAKTALPGSTVSLVGAQEALRKLFKTRDQMERGPVRFLIKHLLPEGIVFIGGLSNTYKTWFALSIAKALTTGASFLGLSRFEVPERLPLLYMVPEMGERAFGTRMDKMGIADGFHCRTMKDGLPLALDDGNLLALVHRPLSSLYYSGAFELLRESHPADYKVRTD